MSAGKSTIVGLLDRAVKVADLRARCRASQVLRSGSFERRCTAELALLRALAKQLDGAADRTASTSTSTASKARP